MELSYSNFKKLLVFSQKKAFLIFRETKAPKKFLVLSRESFSGNGNPKQFFIFQETELSYISGKGNPKKLFRK